MEAYEILRLIWDGEMQAGAIAGAMIGGGASAIWQSMKTDSPRHTASTGTAP